MNQVKLSILIPAYNVVQFIEKALDSILNQKNIDPSLYEVIIVNDGSHDETEQVIKTWIKKNSPGNFFYHKKQNGNWGSVINYAKNKRIIKGEYVSILDADDFYLDNAFATILPYLNKKNDLVLSNYYENKNEKYHRTHVVFSKTKNVNPKKCHSGWSIPLCKFYKSQLFYKMPQLKEGVSYQDQILFHSFLLKAKKVYFINKHLGVYWVERVGSSTVQTWSERRIKLWVSNMTELIKLNSPQINAYVLMMIWYAKIKIKEDDQHLFVISPKNIQKLKKAKFSWLPFGTRKISKLFFWNSTKKFMH